MTTALWYSALILADEAAPATRGVNFSDLRQSLQQWNGNNGNNGDSGSYMWFLGFIVLVAICAIAARLYERWHTGLDLSPAAATAASPMKNLHIQCSNFRCRSILIVPDIARGKIIKCSQCARLVKVPAHAPAYQPSWLRIRT